MNSNLDLNIIQSDETTVKARLNKEELVAVHRQKLFKSSPYFQNMLSSCFKDHISEFVEVNYQASFETFKRAMDFVNKGEIVLCDENVFSTFELADYLQMDMLKKCCLDHFSSSLTRDNVQTKFDQLKQLNFPVEEFKQRALSFIENISNGLYYIRIKPYEKLRFETFFERKQQFSYD